VASSTPGWFTAADAPRIADVLERARELRSIGDLAARADRLRTIASADGNAPLTFALCRLLFSARPGAHFRAPRLGTLECIGQTVESDWPLAPIAVVDDTPIAILTGVRLAGLQEQPLDYLEYCLATCQWSENKIADASRAGTVAAVLKLSISLPTGKRLRDLDIELLARQCE
jgi:hypothetical protein